jgi:hypothetical protein
MYKHAYQVLVALTLFAGLMVPATHAQSIMLKADIPFDFVVGDKQLPSGEYRVKQINPGTTLIQGKDSHSSAAVFTTTAQAAKISDVGKLVFNRYGDQYFLSKIWEASSVAGRQVVQSRVERELAQRLSHDGTTVIAAKSVPKK